MKSAAILVLPFLLLVPGLAAQEKPKQLTIQNDSLMLVWEAAGTFRVTSKKTGKTFLNSGKLEGQSVEAVRRVAQDPTFGNGGSNDEISCGVPPSLFRPTGKI